MDVGNEVGVGVAVGTAVGDGVAMIGDGEGEGADGGLADAAGLGETSGLGETGATEAVGDAEGCALDAPATIGATGVPDPPEHDARANAATGSPIESERRLFTRGA